jgi:hypothetical protein
MSGLIGTAMEEGGASQQEGLPPKTPATFMTFQVLLHLFKPENAQRWAQSAAQDPVTTIAKLATQAVMTSLQSSGGRASPEDAQEALREVVSSMVMFMVAAKLLLAEQAEQVAQQALAQAVQGGGEQPVPPQDQGGPPMPPQQQGGMPPQQPGGMMQ